MKPRRPLISAVLIASALLLTPALAFGDSGTETYLLAFGGPNEGVAANGDMVEVTCEGSGGECGTFSVNPKSITASGEFTHFNSSGGVAGFGTWEATQLISYQSYGCGEVLGDQIPPDFCGGAVRFGVELTTPIGVLDGVMTIFCIVGPNPPNNHDDPSGEGVTLVVPGVINFNHTVHGDNVFIRLD